MIINKIVVGLLQENCYIIENNNTCLVVDPGDEINKILDKISDKKVLGILITHYHFDHIGAKEELIDKYKVKVYDYNQIGQTIKIGEFVFKIIDTKGHTTDSVSFYFEKEKVMFTGDFLFKLSIGRCDFSESDEGLMNKSIKRIKEYPMDLKIYPGHGDETTLEFELNNNYFLK